MQKTVQVVDALGNRYEATYAKRAKGLVKNGRARFIDEDTICLVRPPDIMEDNKMTDTEKNTVTVQESEAAAKYTLDYALSQLEKLAGSEDCIAEALRSIAALGPAKGPGDNNAESIAKVIQCRETTKQKLIDFYAGMINDLKPRTEEDKQAQFLAWVKECITNRRMEDPAYGMEEFGELWKMMNGLS